MAAPVFKDVFNILENIITNWETGNGSPARLSEKHGATFLWDTRDHLVAAQFQRPNQAPIPLIQPEIIGKKGLGNTANIVIDLTKGLATPAKKFPQMPLGGLDANSDKYLDPASPEIQTIVNWIEGGCLS